MAMLRNFQVSALRPSSASKWAALTLLGWALLSHHSLLAYSGSRVQIPGKPNYGRLQIQVDFGGVDSPGYRLIQVELINQVDNPVKGANPPQFAGPTKRDRKIEITITPYYNWGGKGVEVRQVIIIPKGATSASATILRPEYSTNYYASILAKENGSFLPDIEGPFQAGNNNGNSTEDFPSILLIDRHAPLRKNRQPAQSVLGPGMAGRPIPAPVKTPATGAPPLTLPDFRKLLELVPDRNNSRTQLSVGPVTTDDELLNLILSHSYFDCLPPAELPKRWLELSQYGVIFISLEELALLEKSEREALRALGHWLRSGGSLWVYDLGDELEKLAHLAQLLETSLPVPQVSQTLIKDSPTSFARSPFFTFGNSSAATHQVGLGQLVALGTESPFPGSPQDWEKFENVLTPQRTGWHEKYGMSLNETNTDFWNWPIPGYGAAPVISFLILSTLFALAIGPINYWYLQKMRRNYLLLLTVPVGAAVVTLLLFTYALLADGLGTRVRVRSYTQLDQKYGTAVSWSRQTYYASVAPSRGMQYTENEAIFPLEYQPTSQGRGNASSQYAVHWTGSEQQLEKGYIASRTFAQQMVVHADRSSSKLLVTQPTPEEAPKVGNYLAGKITTLYLRTTPGAWYVGADIEREKSATLTPSTTEARQKSLRYLANKFSPTFPEGYENDNQESVLYRIFGFRGSSFYSSSRSNPHTSSSLLETNLQRLITAPGQTIFQPLALNKAAPEAEANSKPVELLIETFLAPGTYLAIVEDPNDVPLGVANAQHLASFQVIEGNW